LFRNLFVACWTSFAMLRSFRAVAEFRYLIPTALLNSVFPLAEPRPLALC
jgi:hypothetical protein